MRGSGKKTALAECDEASSHSRNSDLIFPPFRQVIENNPSTLTCFEFVGSLCIDRKHYATKASSGSVSCLPHRLLRSFYYRQMHLFNSPSIALFCKSGRVFWIIHFCFLNQKFSVYCTFTKNHQFFQRMINEFINVNDEKVHAIKEATKTSGTIVSVGISKKVMYSTATLLIRIYSFGPTAKFLSIIANWCQHFSRR